MYFDSSLTVFAGRNGGGKSTILEALAIMLSWFPVQMGEGVQAEKIKDKDITHGRDYSKLALEVESEGRLMTLTMSKHLGRSQGAQTEGMSDALDYGRGVRVSMEGGSGIDTELPVFAFYRANRNIKGKMSPLPIESMRRNSIYKNAFLAGTDFNKFTRWFAKELSAFDLELSKLQKNCSDESEFARKRLSIEEKYSFIKHIKQAIGEFLPPQYKFHQIKGRLFIKDIPADLLSQGERTVIALITDIAMRMVVANPDNPNPLESNAIVLVDELDIHLHPEWQAEIAQKLPKIFPNTQFIISSHSPSVMSVARNSYKVDGNFYGAQVQHVDSTYGREPSDILSNVMQAKRESSVAGKIEKLYSAIDRKKFNEATKLLAELHEEIPDDPELVRADYLIRALNR